MISVVIASCLNKPERFDYLTRTVESIVENIPFAEILIGFDKNICIQMDGIVSHCHNEGLGHSWNWGLENSSYDYVLQIEDDWTISFSENCKDKESLEYHIKKRISILERFGGIYKFDFPPNIKGNKWSPGFKTICFNHYDFFEQMKEESIKNWWTNPLIYFYTNRPHLKNKKIHKKIGLYEENVPPPNVEVPFCEKYLESKERVFYSDFDVFKHIGEVQSR